MARMNKRKPKARQLAMEHRKVSVWIDQEHAAKLDQLLRAAGPNVTIDQLIEQLIDRASIDQARTV